MSAWIESHQALGQHPKTIRLAALLKRDLPTVVGHLHYLWWWALDYAPDGRLGKHGPEVVAHACLWKGSPQKLVEALEAAGFVDSSGDMSSIHDWDDYAGALLERRARDADRKRTSRGRSPDVHGTSNGTSDTRPRDVRETSVLARGGPTQPDQPDQPDRTVPTGPDPPNPPARGASGRDKKPYFPTGWTPGRDPV